MPSTPRKHPTLPVTYVNDEVCDLCKIRMQDVAQFNAGFFIQGTICDTCAGKLLRGYDPTKKGPTVNE